MDMAAAASAVDGKGDISRAVRSEMKEIFVLSWPVSLTRLIICITRLAPVVFVGRLGSATALAATSLAFTIANVTGYSLMMSFVNGLATLAGQAYGAKDYATVGYNFQCALLLATAIGIFPVSVIWIFSKSILIFLGQEETVSTDAAKFLFIIVPSIFTFAYRQCIQIWCQAQGIVRPFTYNAFAIFVLSIPITYYLVRSDGFIGGAIAQIIITTMMCLFDAGYVFFSGVYKKTWLEFSLKKASYSLKRMFKLAVLSQIMSTEWWASEITILMAGRLYPNEEDADKNAIVLSAMACFMAINYTCMMLLIGPQLATAARVSNRLGSGSAMDAGVSGVSGIIVSSVVGVVMGVLLIIFRDGISASLSSDMTVVALVKRIMWPLSMYQVGTGMCSALEGILIGSRRQAKGAICVVVAFYLIGIPMSYVCGYTLKMGTVGLVIGRVIGKVVQLVFYAILVIRTDWDEQVARAVALMSKITVPSRAPTALAAFTNEKTAENGGIEEPLLVRDDDDHDDDDHSQMDEMDGEHQEASTVVEEEELQEEKEGEHGETFGQTTKKRTTDTEKE